MTQRRRQRPSSRLHFAALDSFTNRRRHIKTILSITIFAGAKIAVERRGDTYVVTKRYGVFGNSDVQEFTNPDDALHAASVLAEQKSLAMHGFYKSLEDSHEER